MLPAIPAPGARHAREPFELVPHVHDLDVPIERQVTASGRAARDGGMLGLEREISRDGPG
jgi:hypothetical protein